MISGQSFTNEICHNSRRSHDIGVKLGPRLKLGKRNIEILKEIKDDVISAICDVIAFFLIYYLVCSHPEAGFRIHGL